MIRPSFLILFASAGLALTLAAAPMEAQLVEVSEKRFEITPIAGYQWGGSFDTHGNTLFPDGELRLQPSFAWGAVLSFLAYGNSAVELSYLRQDTDIEFDPIGAGTATNLGGFAMNYVQIGGRAALRPPRRTPQALRERFAGNRYSGSRGGGGGVCDPVLLELRRRRPVHVRQRAGGTPHRPQVLDDAGSVRLLRDLV